MSDVNRVQANLLVLYSPRLEECQIFYGNLGLRFATEQHGQGPRHYAATLAGGLVFEIYPAGPGRATGALRLGLTVTGAAATPPLAPGRHLLTDPDGRTVDIRST